MRWLSRYAPAVRLNLVADLDRRVESVGRGASEDGPVSEKHGRGAVIAVI